MRERVKSARDPRVGWEWAEQVGKRHSVKKGENKLFSVNLLSLNQCCWERWKDLVPRGGA